MVLWLLARLFLKSMSCKVISCSTLQVYYSVGSPPIDYQLIRVLLLNNILMIQNHQGLIASGIKADSWHIFTKKYAQKYKKQWKDQQFTVVASVVFVDVKNNSYQIASVGFGTKSLPQSAVNQQNLSHLIADMHAQMLAIQAFKRFVLKDISHEQKYFEWDDKRRKFELKGNWRIWLYCSELFCGDCCVNEKQQSFSGAKPLKYLKEDKYPQLKYESLILRTKPGRLDLPGHKRSAILSCSDKIAFYNLTGIQGRSLFSQIVPIYLDAVVVECQPALKQNITRGINFLERLSLFLNRPESLIKRQLFNVVLEGKERKVSNQFRSNKPQVIVLARQEKNKSRDQEGFEMCGIFCLGYEEWLNGKTGLPEGSSLKNYQTKGKVSLFSQRKLAMDFKDYKAGEDSFKWQSVERRCKLLWGQWLSPEQAVIGVNSEG